MSDQVLAGARSMYPEMTTPEPNHTRGGNKQADMLRNQIACTHLVLNFVGFWEMLDASIRLRVLFGSGGRNHASIRVRVVHLEDLLYVALSCVTAKLPEIASKKDDHQRKANNVVVFLVS